ncbi:PREDICTED: heat shock factor protein-like isoform X2 [Dinoponera quadriceps]|uniref:Heat shock factor protein-like isoform X2 n=1 Tax=Dinoponera quadriceps TaxID=609295 RepID=A0A6P3Y0V8_DINQU|nr:PREDICTED: heat shock factor protein-like isoform X2 [Dinoponera quadriceps]
MNKVAKAAKSVSPDGEASTSQPHGNVAMFVAKLWAIVNMPETNNLICWSASGKSFIIKDSARFAKELLPHYYKHNHMASFVRQLNMYGFHKKASVEQGGLKCDKDEMEFAHPHFCKGHNYTLPQIKRKIAHNKIQNQDIKEPSAPDLVSSVLTDVKTMRARQDEFEKLLNTVKHENTTLWRELMILSQKNMQQHKLINKLIHFLVTLVQSRRNGLTVKRRLYHPLMIDNSSPPRRKSKLAEPQTSPTGPVIHELDASEPGLASEYIDSDMLESEDPAVQSPGSTDGYTKLEVPVDDDSEESIHLITHPEYSEASEIKIPGPSDADEIETSGQFEADEIGISDSLEADEIEMLDSSEVHVIQEVLDKETWKTKVPVKILIPPLENGEKPREELHLLEMPVSEETPMNVAILNDETIGSKPVPVATVRSSKLMAMAANMKNCQQNIDQEIDMEPSVDVDVDDDTSDNDTFNSGNFGDALIQVPDVCNNHKTRNNVSNRINVGRRPSKINESSSHIYNGKSVLKSNSNRNRYKENAAVKSPREENDSCNVASTSKDLSLSCVNSSGVAETNYRDTLCSYLETMENNLEGFRERLNGDGYSIDANTILELLNSDDAISFAIPDLPPDLPSELLLNSELNPEENCKKVEENHIQNPESLSGLNRGELMTYNSSNVLDLDDIFLNGNPSSSLATPETTNVTADLTFDPDSLNEEDDKIPLFNLDNFQNNDMDSRL